MNDQHEDLPKPTFWPMFFAFSIMLIAWGLITSWVVSAVGAFVLIAAIVGWIKEIS